MPSGSFVDYCAYICASVAGLLMFCIGTIGLSGMPFTLSPTVTVLLRPLGYGERFDIIYYVTMVVLGIWLVLYLRARLAAILALVLVAAKIALV